MTLPRYAATRLLHGAIVIVIVTSIVFILMHAAPGDPFAAALDNASVSPGVRAAWRAAYGFDRPVSEQYVRYLVAVGRGDFGWSFSMQRPALTAIAAALPNTLLLVGVAGVASFGLGIATALAQASRPGSIADRVIGAGSLLLHSLPDFWLALVLLLALAYWIPIFPAGGVSSLAGYDALGWSDRLGDRLRHLVLPALTLTLLTAGGIARYQRSALLGELPGDYVRTARAKGVGEHAVLFRHVFRNALLPMISLAGLLLPAMFTGAVFVEKIFAWPGIGWMLVNAVATRDYALVTAGVIVTSAVVVAGSVAADVLYAAADPRFSDAHP